MLLLSAPFEPAAAAPGPVVVTRAYAYVGAAAGLVVAASLSLDLLGAWPAGLGRALAAGTVHGGLIALGWLVATGAATGWIGPALRLAAAAGLASVGARLGPWGALGFLALPALVMIEARGRPEIRAMGLGGARLAHATAGLAAGAFLGAHLLVTASLTFGYRVHTSDLAAYAGALAYDAGANVVSAEWLFRGALFSACWRRASFWPAALLTTALALARYLLDPALPAAVEARAGAVFYLGLVGLTACALRAWSGSLLPGYLAGLAFFAAYRTLSP
ncbi:MAG TPA: CPBP family glutamic-type intramembrane protease [Methylomirabilota bacterium]|jgi:hypothetical protein